MGTIAQAKTLGQVGSILVLLAIIPAFGSIVAIIGLILTLIAVKYISEALNDSSIFSNILIAIVLAIIGVVVGGVLVIGAVFRYIGLRSLVMGTVSTTTPPTHILGLVGGIIVGLVVIWIMFIIAAFFQRKSLRGHCDKVERWDVSNCGANLPDWRGSGYSGSWTSVTFCGTDTFRRCIFLDQGRRSSDSYGIGYNATSGASNANGEVLRKVWCEPSE